MRIAVPRDSPQQSVVMNMRWLAIFLVIPTLTGCVSDHSLGTTLSDAGGEGGGSGDTGENTGGPISATGQGEGAAETSAGDSMVQTDGEGDTAASDSDETDQGSDTGVQLCDASGESFQWLFGESDFQDVGELWNDRVVVDADCQVQFVDSDPLDPSIKGIGLTCTADLIADGIAMSGVEWMPFIAAGGSVVQTALEAQDLEGDSVRVRLAQRDWGQAFHTWFVMLDDRGDIIFDGFDAADANPVDDPIIGADVTTQLDGAQWHADIAMVSVDAECDFGPYSCDGIGQALRVVWEGGTTTLEAQALTAVDLGFAERTMYVPQAVDHTDQPCLDTPLRVLQYAAYRP